MASESELIQWPTSGFGPATSAVVDRNPAPITAGFGICGHYPKFTCVGPDGKVKWVAEIKNGMTDVGVKHLLDVACRGATQITTWFLGLVDNAGFTAFAFGDTMTVHSGWSEFTGFSNSTRVAWTPGSPGTFGGSSPSWTISNATTNDFNMTSTGTMKGAFLISDSTKGGTTGTLLSTGSFTGGTQPVSSGDTLKVTYVMQGTAT